MFSWILYSQHSRVPHRQREHTRHVPPHTLDNSCQGVRQKVWRCIYFTSLPFRFLHSLTPSIIPSPIPPDDQRPCLRACFPSQALAGRVTYSCGTCLPSKLRQQDRGLLPADFWRRHALLLQRRTSAKLQSSNHEHTNNSLAQNMLRRTA